MLRLRELGKEREKKGKVCTTLISHRFRKGDKVNRKAVRDEGYNE